MLASDNSIGWCWDSSWLGRDCVEDNSEFDLVGLVYLILLVKDDVLAGPLHLEHTSLD